MDLFLAISQGIGTSLAAGVRAFLVPLLVGTLARANVGVDFEGTEFEFLESVVWLAILLSLIVGAWLIERADIPVAPATWAIAGAAIGGVLFAGSLAERDYMSEPGLVAGRARRAARVCRRTGVPRRCQERLSARGEGDAGATLGLIADAAVLAVAVLAVLVEPTAYLALAFCVWVLVVRRRRAGQKYEGLRILR